MKRIGVGAIAVAGSLFVHLAVGVVVLPALAARQPSPQDIAKSKLALASVKVKRNRATQTPPDAQNADKLEADGARIDNGPVPVRRAAVRPAFGAYQKKQPINDGPKQAAQSSIGDRQSARAPRGEVVAATTTDSAISKGLSLSENRQQSQAIIGETRVALVVPSEKQAARVVSSQKQPALNIGTEKAAAKAILGAKIQKAIQSKDRPTTPVSLEAKGTVQPLGMDDVPKPQNIALDAQALVTATPKSNAAPRVVPDVPVVKAGLAWSGPEQLVLDSQSVATLAAFLQPGAAEGAELRDEMATLMAGPACSRIHTVFDPDTGGLELRGHVPDPAIRAPLLAAMQAQVGSGLMLTDKLRILPEPQCGLLDGIADLGLPQSEEQLTDQDLVGEHAQVREYAFSEGDRLTIELSAPDYPSYVYVDYFDAMGQVIHLRPNVRAALVEIPAEAAFSIGRGDDLDLRIAPPFGQDIAVAFASTVPLYEGVRPLVEPALPYLEEMKQMIAQHQKDTPSFKGEWVYLFVATTPADR